MSDAVLGLIIGGVVTIVGQVITAIVTLVKVHKIKRVVKKIAATVDTYAPQQNRARGSPAPVVGRPIENADARPADARTRKSD